MMRIASDRYNQAKRKHEDFFGNEYPFEAIPVDIFGARTDYKKGDSDNLDKAEKDVRERFDLDVV